MLQPQRFRTKKGVEFELDVSRATLPAQADYWKYVVRATSSGGPGLTFVAVLRKRAFPSPGAADTFVLGDPLSEIKARLNIADSDGTPLFWPDFQADWTVL